MYGMELGWLGMLAFWTFFALVVVWGLASLGRDDRGDARSILDERFARGEIDADELKSRRQLIDP